MYLKFITKAQDSDIPPTKYAIVDYFQSWRYDESMNKFCWHTKLACVGYVPSELLDEYTEHENYQDIADIYARINEAKRKGEL